MSGFSDFFGSGTESNSNENSKFTGVTIGVVTENFNDKFPGMVKVSLVLGVEGENVTDWVRVMTPYAGNGYGMYMLPEIGDEVVVAFHLGEISKPIVIGSIWNGKQEIPAETALKDNIVKRIKTKGGHEIVFKEKASEEELIIHTPANNTIILHDKEEKITIADSKSKNTVMIETKSGKISVTAEKVISLDAGGASLELNGSGKSITMKSDNITIQATKALKLKGQTLNAEGNMTTIKGSSTGKFEAGSMLTLKGGMVKIN